MDVSLSGRRVFFKILILGLGLSQISCGNRYDLSTERGRRSRIDDANFHLSRGECAEASEAIGPLYSSTYVNDEIRIVMASALACYAGFNLLTFVASLTGSSSIFQAFAKSLSSTPGDNTRNYLFQAVDVLTQSNRVINAIDRGSEVNTFMVFLQFGVISAQERSYGLPGVDGSQGADLKYETPGNPAGEMTNVDACGLAAAFSHISDSYHHSSLTDANSASAIDSLDSICVGMGKTSCAELNRYRESCDGTNAYTVDAVSIVAGVNAGW